MSPTIRIDDQVYAWLQQQAKAFEDTPNTVLRRVAGIDNALETTPQNKQQVREVAKAKGDKTPQWAYRKPILRVLKKLGGEGSRARVLQELAAMMADDFTKADKEKISSGTIRWQKTAEWEVRVMREEGLLRPVVETASGIWALTRKGQEAMRAT
jgi:hypothetical protein